MPQLVKGGKFVFGWSVVGPGGEIVIPPDAFTEYGFVPGEAVVLFSASRTSGGFILARRKKVAESPMAPVLADLDDHPVVKKGWRTWAVANMGAGSIAVPPAMLAAFGVLPGGRVLAVRGSHMGLSMIRKGRIILEARKHDEIPSYPWNG